MAKDSDNSGPNWRGVKGKIERKNKKQDWQNPGQPVVSTEGMGQRLRIVAYFVGVLACVAGLVILIRMLSSPTPPLVVVVANQPSDDALYPDAPLDFYGWKGAKSLASWININQNTEKPNPFVEWIFPTRTTPSLLGSKPDPHPMPENIKELVDKIKTEVNANNPKPEYVLIYFSVLGTINNEGNPCLFTAKGKTVSVEDLLTELNDASLHKTRILLCFDAARLHYAPRLGIIHNDFARNLKDIYNKVFKDKELSNIAIFCSSKPDQLAWDSEQAGKSVFLMKLMEALKSTETSNLSVESLIKKVTDETEDWTKKRCITAQTPWFITNADKINEWSWPTIKTAGDDKQMADKAKAQEDSIKSKHQQALELAKLVPGPEVYLPVQWRYYRELISRYEKAVLAQDDECATKIEGRLEELAKKIGLEHIIASKTAKDTTLAMRKFLTSPTNKAEGGDDSDIRLAENQFAVRLKEDYPTTIVSKPDNALTKTAIEVRKLAENAALALKDEKLYSYSERLWPLIHEEIKQADVLRREGEDLLFASDPKAKEKLDQAKKLYTAALTDVDVIQKSWQTYHRAASMLPELVEWRTHQIILETNKAIDAPELQPCRACITTYVELEKELKNNNNLALTAWKDRLIRPQNELDESLNKLLKEYEGRLKEPNSPKDRYEIEAACSIPFVADVRLVDLRRAALQSAQKLDRTYFDANLTAPPNPITVDTRNLSIHRLALLHHLLKPEEPIDPGSPIKTLMDQGSKLKAKWASLCVNLKPGLLESDLLENDYRSRLSLKFCKSEENDPAQLLRDIQWKTVLMGQAKRFALDHWYTGEVRYYRTIAEACLNDAKEIDAKTEPDAELKALMEAKPLRISTKTNTLAWTSELNQNLVFTIDNLPVAQLGKGYIACWQPKPSHEKTLLKVDGNQPPNIQLGIKETMQTILPIKLVDPFTDTPSSTIKVQQKAYFRGQSRDAEVTINLNNQPSRIVTWQKPEGPASFVVNSASDLGIGMGHIAFVLDYSGSMIDTNDGAWPDNENIRETTRNRIAINTLSNIINLLPNDTDISIYVFSDVESSKHVPNRDNFNQAEVADLTNKTKCRIINTGTINKGGGELIISDKSGQTYTLKDIITRLKSLTPRGFTPLIQSISHCAKDLSDINGASTIVVLTDGMDTSEGDLTKGMPQAEKNRAKSALSIKISNVLENHKSNIHMVFFQTQEEEKKIASEVFINNINEKFRGRITKHEAKNTTELQAKLLEVLRPNVKLLRNNNTAFTVELTRRNNKNNDVQKIHDMVCSPEIKEPDYNTKYDIVVGNDNSSGRRIRQGLSFGPGDFMFLQLKGDKLGNVQFTRELYCDKLINDKLPKYRSAVRRYHEPPWYACLAGNEVGSFGGKSYRTIRMCVENDEASPTAKKDRLEVTKPEKWTWWDVEYIDMSGKSTTPSRLHVRNVHESYFAPAWDLQLDSAIPDNTATVNIHIRPDMDTGTTLRPLEVKQYRGDEPATYDEYQVRCSYVREYRKYSDNFVRGEPIEAIAVQVLFPPGQSPPQLELLQDSYPAPSYIEHLYYQSPSQSSVTVYFCGLNEEAFKSDKLKVKFIKMKRDKESSILCNFTKLQAETKEPLMQMLKPGKPSSK